MESKLFGNDVDKKSHKELLINFTNFLKHFTPLLDATEKYQQVPRYKSIVFNLDGKLERFLKFHPNTTRS